MKDQKFVNYIKSQINSNLFYNVPVFEAHPSKQESASDEVQVGDFYVFCDKGKLFKIQMIN